MKKKTAFCTVCFALWLSLNGGAQQQSSATAAVPANETPVAALKQEIDLLKNGLEEFNFDRPGVPMSKVAKIEDGILHLSGVPTGSLITRRWFHDYEIEVEWRWEPGRPGNGGVLPHVGTPDQIGCWPRSMECQLLVGHAGEFLAIPRRLTFDPKPNANHGGVAKRAPEAGEKPLGEWNNMRIQCRGNTFKIWVNGVFANECTGWPDSQGPLAIQNEGTPHQYRKIVVRPLPKE